MLCSTIVSMYRYKNSGNSFAMEIWQIKPAAQSLLFDLGKTVHLMVSVTIESERPTCDFLSLPSFYVLSVALFFFFCLEFFTFFPTSYSVYPAISHFLHEASPDQTFISFMAPCSSYYILIDTSCVWHYASLEFRLLGVFYIFFCLQYLALCLEYRKCSINIYWISEWYNELINE